MTNTRYMLIVIIVLVLAAGWVFQNKPTKLGLDLSGGVRFVLQAVPTESVPQVTPEAMEILHTVLERRVNPTGTEENLVQKVGNDRMLIEIPGVKDPEKAKAVIGKTGNLEFRALDPETGQFVYTGLSGGNLKEASVVPNSNIPNEWMILLSFDSEGAKKFGTITDKLKPSKAYPNGLPLGIFFDGKQESAPLVKSKITQGTAQITGYGSHEAAQTISDILNAGALPLDVEVIEESTVGPLLGKVSLQKSLKAGVSGLLLVMVFMLVYYRVPGFFANIALLIYALLLMAAIKLTPTALSLSGIAGIILSIGMAVDANILIFERTKEELRLGRSVGKAIDLGFDRAYTSIFDSNMTTIITCIILYALGTGLVKGFAFSLGLGVVISFFTAIVITRTLMKSFVVDNGPLSTPFWLGINQRDTQQATAQ